MHVLIHFLNFWAQVKLKGGLAGLIMQFIRVFTYKMKLLRRSWRLQGAVYTCFYVCLGHRRCVFTCFGAAQGVQNMQFLRAFTCEIEYFPSFYVFSVEISLRRPPRDPGVPVTSFRGVLFWQIHTCFYVRNGLLGVCVFDPRCSEKAPRRLREGPEKAPRRPRAAPELY